MGPQWSVAVFALVFVRWPFVANGPITSHRLMDSIVVLVAIVVAVVVMTEQQAAVVPVEIVLAMKIVVGQMGPDQWDLGRPC